MELLAGRDFTDATRNGENGVIISEACLKTFGLGTAEEALSEKLAFGSDSMAIRGVIKDHNWQSLHKSYTPSAFLYTYATPQYFSLRINPENNKEVVKALEEGFVEAFPNNPLEYYFLDDFFNKQYEKDQQFGTVFKAFAAFAIFAACLGLFGLASYTVIQRAKEIGIRKVLGASSTQITVVFSKSYMLLIIIANIVGIPIAYFGMKSWLQNFAFSVPVTAQLFIVPILLLVIIAAITISLQTLRAATANPIRNLRSE
jgi:putative ABC transport system permease protein